MKTTNFTAKKIEALKFTDKGQVDYFDSKQPLPGQPGQLCLRVGKTTKTFFIQYRFEGKRKKLTLGKFPVMTLKEARDEAAKQLTNIMKGKDPRDLMAAHNATPTVAEFWETYADSERFKKKKQRTQYEEKRMFDVDIVPYLGNKKVTEITAAEIAFVLDKKAARAPVSANRLHALMSVFFKLVLRKGLTDFFIMAGLDRPGGTEKPKKRKLDETEIKAMFAAADTLRPNGRDIFKLILLTAQRPGEVMRMKWEHVDLEKGTWLSVETKTADKDILVPLSAAAVRILKARQKCSEYVFTPEQLRRKKGLTNEHTTSLQRATKNILKASGIDSFTPHDLRRTARSLMSKLKCDAAASERVLGHAMPGVQGVYDVHDYIDDKRAVLDKIGAEIDRITGHAPKPKGELIQLNKVA